VNKESNRPVDADLRDSLINEKYYEWLQEKGENTDIKELMTEAQKTWAYNKVINN
jgi:hypothetical protein